MVKQIHHEPCSYYQFGDKLQSELRDYRTLSALGIPMPRLLGGGRSTGTAGEAVHPRPNGAGTAANGHAAAASRRADAGAVPPFVPCGLNIDYFPTNFILWGGVLYYVDYECNPYDAQWDFSHWGSRYWADTPELRAWLQEHGQN